jgi:hypothetical protein
VSNKKGRFTLVGITSFGKDCGVATSKTNKNEYLEYDDVMASTTSEHFRLGKVWLG